jgi:hypothetical protein
MNPVIDDADAYLRCPYCRAPLQIKSIITVKRDESGQRCRTDYEQRCSAHCASGETWVPQV